MAATAAISKIYFELLNWEAMEGSIRVFVDQNGLKSIWLEIQDGRHSRHFENLFCTAPEPKGHWLKTW